MDKEDKAVLLGIFIVGVLLVIAILGGMTIYYKHACHEQTFPAGTRAECRHEARVTVTERNTTCTCPRN